MLADLFLTVAPVGSNDTLAGNGGGVRVFTSGVRRALRDGRRRVYVGEIRVRSP